jgi:hypothetical protein
MIAIINEREEKNNMHTFNGGSCRIFYDGDFSGEIQIVDIKTNDTVKIDIDDIKMFVAESVRYKRISEIESMNYSDLLK